MLVEQPGFMMQLNEVYSGKTVKSTSSQKGNKKGISKS
jgi:hypothetical protein